MRRDRGTETDSADEDEDDDASAGPEFWVILDTSASTADSISAFSGGAASDFPIVEEADFLELPALFSGPMALVAFVFLPARTSGRPAV